MPKRNVEVLVMAAMDRLRKVLPVIQRE